MARNLKSMKFKGLNVLFKDKLAKERFTFGLDIGSRQIKIVKLKLFKDTTELCGLEVSSVQLDVGALLKKFKHSLDIFSLDEPSRTQTGPSV
ncbi:MAG: hypothetical protein AMJ95_11685 [Omnitrophica WOR_2 bacterium SM23_72]|nr:MAG: hypothetical protein AMJ95_11685 [Omnitrophica WOR_2 bacterium SM23_72]